MPDFMYSDVFMVLLLLCEEPEYFLHHFLKTINSSHFTSDVNSLVTPAFFSIRSKINKYIFKNLNLKKVAWTGHTNTKQKLFYLY